MEREGIRERGEINGERGDQRDFTRDFTTKTYWFYLLFIHEGLGMAHKPVFRLNTGWAWAEHTNLYSGSTQTYIQAQHKPIFRLNTGNFW